MKVVFRVDASLEIGTGHVMRCLTLADALRSQGAECHFICRDHPGSLNEQIKQNGHQLHLLPRTETSHAEQRQVTGDSLFHASWLAATQQQDALESAVVLHALKSDWLIIDHYALDARWQLSVRGACKRIMVIDDLADRVHECDILLDQNLGRQEQDYSALVPTHCRTLVGSRYALLRPEFEALREYSLRRRSVPHLKRLLITMGGVDKDNAAGRVLKALKSVVLPSGCEITVVMGAAAPWLEVVRGQAAEINHPTEVLMGVGDMAQIMAGSDLAIGAAGATSWERCCLGVPSLMVILAENQRYTASALAACGAARIIDNVECQLAPTMTDLLQGDVMVGMARCASAVTDGAGAARVATELRSYNTDAV